MTAQAVIYKSVPLKELAPVIGDQAIAALIARFAGTRIYIPKKIGAHHPIAKALGLEAAALLAENFHGVEFVIPMREGARERVMRIAAAEPELTRSEIALKAGVHERSVYRWLDDSPSRQGSLFD